jgi:hypothetical protein
MRPDVVWFGEMPREMHILLRPQPSRGMTTAEQAALDRLTETGDDERKGQRERCATTSM